MTTQKEKVTIRTSEISEILIDYGLGKNIQTMFKFDNLIDAMKCIAETPPGQHWRMLILTKTVVTQETSHDVDYDGRIEMQQDGYHAVFYD